MCTFAGKTYEMKIKERILGCLILLVVAVLAGCNVPLVPLI